MKAHPPSCPALRRCSKATKHLSHLLPEPDLDPFEEAPARFEFEAGRPLLELEVALRREGSSRPDPPVMYL